jgi:NDP-sugar pyrophosphorylase family protein
MLKPMNKPIHLLIPMSGQGTRYKKAGYLQPKPLIPVNGTPMIERLLACFSPKWLSHFVLAENHRESGAESFIRRLRNDATISYIPEHSLGPSEAILCGLENIPDDDAVFVSYCDYGMVWDANRFEEFVRYSSCDSCLVSYRGFHAHYLSSVKYAYSRMAGERVVEVREKGSFTENRENEYASAGGYYFKSARSLREAIQFQYANEIKVNGEFYTSLTVQSLLEMKKDSDVRVFEIPGFFQWGTPADLQNFEFWEKSFRAYIACAGREVQVGQILMPMAGFGSRFRAVTDTLKPLIPIDGQVMFRAALNTLPRAKKNIFVTLDSIAGAVAAEAGPGAKIVALKETPSGQALSVAAGLDALVPESDIIITSCDHGLAVDPDLWNGFRESPQCDAAIFVIRGYPGAARRPTAFAYVVADASDLSSTYPLVSHVSVKNPVSDAPMADNLLVGTFWFKDKTVLTAGLDELKRRDTRVNGELYLDSIFECLMSMGKKVRMIPLEGYLCWGDPDSLAEALYWQDIFVGRTIERRARFPGISKETV